MKVVNTAGQILGITGAGGAGYTAGFSTQGNTSGDTGMVTGQLLLVGGNNVTLSGSTNAGSITISISGGTAAAAPVNFSAGTTSNNLGSVVFADSNRVSFGLAGSTITAKHALNFSAGTTSNNVSDQIVFSNSNNVSFGINGSTITATATVAAQSAIKALGVSNTGNTAGNTGVSSGIDWVIAGSNGITASQSTAGGGPNTIWLSGATQTVQTQGITADELSIGVSTGGNTAGNTTVNTGQRLVFVGSNGITLSQGTGAGSTTITISGTIPAAQTTQSAIKAFGASNTGNTAGNTGVSTGVDWVLAGSNSITISESTVGGGPNTLWIQMTAPAGAAGLGAMGVSNTGTTAGNTGTSSTGTWVFAASGNITASQSTGAGSVNTIWYSVPNQTVQTQGITVDELSIGVSTGGNTQGNTTVNTGQRFVFVGTNGITLSQATGAGSTTISISGNAAQTNQSAIKALGVSNTGSTAGNTGVSTGVDWVLAGSNSITLSQSTVGGGPNTIWFQMTQPAGAAGIGGIGVSNTGTTAGNTGTSGTGTWVFAASGNITASQSTGAGSVNTIWYSVPNQTAQTVGLYMSSNTTSSVSSGTVDARSLTFRGMGVASVGYSGGEVIVSVPAGAGTVSSATTVSRVESVNVIGADAGRYALEGHQHAGLWAINVGGNTSGGNTSSGAGSLMLAGGPNITLSGSTAAGGMTLSVSADGGVTGSFLNPFHQQQGGSYINATQWPGNGAIQVFPFNLEGAYSFSKFLMSVSLSLSTSSNSSHGGTISLGVGWYSRNGSTLSLATSGLGAPVWTNTSNNSTASLSGIREISGTFANMNLTPGDWWIAVWSRTSTVNANWYTASNIYYGTVASNSVHSGDFGAAAGAASHQAGIPGNGTYSATSAALPVSMAFSHITGTLRSALRPHIAFRNFDA